MHNNKDEMINKIKQECSDQLLYNFAYVGFNKTDLQFIKIFYVLHKDVENCMTE